MILGAGGAGYIPEYRELVELYGEGQLCVIQNENLVANGLTSAYLLSIFTVKLAATGLTSAYTLLAYQSKLEVVASPASAYSLAVA